MGRRLLIAALACAPLLACSLLSLPGTDGVVAPLEEGGGGTPDVSTPDVTTDVTSPDAGSPYPTTILGDNPKRYYRFDDKDGDPAVDRIKGINGKYESSGVTYGVTGAIANDPSTAIQIDGASGAISLPVDLDFPGNAPMSVEVWIKIPQRPAGLGFVIDHETYGSRGGWGLIFSNDQLDIERYGNDKIITAAGVGEPDDGQWHHVVATYDGSTIKTYLDANLVRTLASTPTISYDTDAGVNMTVGRQACTGCHQHLKGTIDELAIYDYALSQTRVKAHFDAAH